MLTSGNGLIQCMEIKKDMNSITTGDFKSVSLIHCVEDGDIIVRFIDGDETVPLKTGDDRTVPGLDITVVSGKFDLN